MGGSVSSSQAALDWILFGQPARIARCIFNLAIIGAAGNYGVADVSFSNNSLTNLFAGRQGASDCIARAICAAQQATFQTQVNFTHECSVLVPAGAKIWLNTFCTGNPFLVSVTVIYDSIV